MANRRYAQSTLGVCVCFIGDTWSVIKVNFSGRTTGQTYDTNIIHAGTSPGHVGQ